MHCNFSTTKIRDGSGDAKANEAYIPSICEAFREALKDNASAVILTHIHPSGCPEPSVEDVRITERLVDAGKIIGIPVLDHLILGDGIYYSFSDNQRI